MAHSDNLVEISGLNFWYDKRRPILSGIDMAIPRGKAVPKYGLAVRRTVDRFVTERSLPRRRASDVRPARARNLHDWPFDENLR